MTESSVEPTVLEFANEIARFNPFLRDRVNTMSATEIDVPAIHAGAYRSLTRRLKEVTTHNISLGVTVMGGAGVGKSHLLNRLYWSTEACPSTRVFLHNLQASPDGMPRYLLRSVVSTLKGPPGTPATKSPLLSLIDTAARSVLAADTSYSGLTTPQGLNKARAELCTRLVQPGSVIDVLLAYARSVFEMDDANVHQSPVADLALTWLAGGSIDAEDGRNIGLPLSIEDQVAVADDAEVEQVLRVLIDLGRLSARPFVLCIDQVDNLDDEKVRALSVFLHSLMDKTLSLLVILAGVGQSLASFKRRGIIAEAAWDRLAQFTVELPRLSPEETVEVLRARIHSFSKPHRTSPAVERLYDTEPLFPLSKEWFEARRVDALEIRPRVAISWAREAWEAHQDHIDDKGVEHWLENMGWSEPKPQDPTEVVQQRLSELKDERFREPAGLPPDADNMATLLEQLLEYCKGREEYTLTDFERASRRSHRRSRLPCDLVVHEVHPETKSPVVTWMKFAALTSKQAGFWLMKKLHEIDPVPDHILLVTDHERMPLPLGARGQELYNELLLRGAEAFSHIQLSFEEYAMLDALTSIIGEARAGDIEVEETGGQRRTLAVDEVVSILHSLDQFRAHRVLRELLSEPPSDAESAPEPCPWDESFAINMILGELAWQLMMSTEDATAIYLERKSCPPAHADHIRPKLVSLVDRLDREGLIYVDVRGGDRFMQYRNH